LNLWFAAGRLTPELPNGIHFAMRLTLDKMSRLVVPKPLRDRFALKPGDELEVTIEADGIRLRPALPASPLAEENGILVCSSEVPHSAWDLGTFIEGQRDQRSREIGGI
jgi:AbrB family looped-hinge helix DNA binding protein